MRRAGRGLIVLVALVLLAGCTRGPDPESLQGDVQLQLDNLFGSRTLEVKRLNRQGSAPLAGANESGQQVIVYYNAVLEFNSPYDPSDWSGLSPELIASALGATDGGVFGLGAGKVAAGSQLRAYGSMVYRQAGNSWQPTLLPPFTATPAAGGDAIGSSSDLIEYLARIVDTTRGLHSAEDVIIAEEINQALQDIKLRLARSQQNLVVATGPAEGEYARFFESLRPRGVDWPVTQANTTGSVENALLLDSGEARFALVQSDVAAAAVTGHGAFTAQGALRYLRGVAALFPEPLHIVVRADAGIASVRDLRGARVALGSRGSGTRWTAIQVLREHGLQQDDYTTVDAQGPDEALELLLSRRADAVIEVLSAPWRRLATIGEQTPVTLLPLEPDAMSRLGEYVPGLLPFTILQRTYPWLEHDLPTLAATALLVANSAEPETAVRQVLGFLFEDEQASARGVSASRLSRERAMSGLTIPLHSGAVKFFADAPEQGPTGAE